MGGVRALHGGRRRLRRHPCRVGLLDESAWYGELLGNQARFANHPGGVGGSPGCIGDFPGDPQVVRHTGSCFQATIVTEDGEHPTTQDLPERWDISDEWYNFKANPRSTVHVLQTLDESSYNFQPHRSSGTGAL